MAIAAIVIAIAAAKGHAMATIPHILALIAYPFLVGSPVRPALEPVMH
jgi:hypothetical protein